MTVANESTVIVEAIQTIFLGMSEFASQSVVISYWDIFDESEADAPWVLINRAGLQQGIDNTFGCDGNTWTVDVGIWIPFNKWEDDLEQLSQLRDAVLSEFTVKRNLETTALTASLNTIADLTPAFPFTPYYLIDDGTSMPDMIHLDMVFTIITQE